MARFSQVDLDSPDPTDAINAFLWNMRKARQLGFTPPNKWVLAEHFFRDDVSLLFYESGGGTIILGADETALDDDSHWEFVMKIIERVTARRKALNAAQTEEPKVEVGEEVSRALPIMPRQKGGLQRAAQRTAAGPGIDA